MPAALIDCLPPAGACAASQCAPQRHRKHGRVRTAGRRVRVHVPVDRAKEIQLIKAREEAEQNAIEVMVGADAEKKAALDQAEARLTEARANAERIRVVAEADQKRLEVEAFGVRSINEAKNLLSSEISASSCERSSLNWHRRSWQPP